MSGQIITSSLEITNWLCRRAESEKDRLTEAKLQHLLFLAQIHYALKSGKFLMPSLFVCGRSGFYEPTIRQIMSFGLPLMKAPAFKEEIDAFLELIWKKYAKQTESELEHFILSLDCFKHFYRPEEETIVNPMYFTDSFAGSIQKTKTETSGSQIRLSQNGPVKVSAWTPRKLHSDKK